MYKAINTCIKFEIHVKPLSYRLCYRLLKYHLYKLVDNICHSDKKLVMHCNYLEISSVNCLSGIRCLFINTEEGSAKPTTCPGGSLVVVIV